MAGSINGAKHFTVDARTILQLGRQSIRDHTTALLELVKNGYDADATQVFIELLQRSDSPSIRVSDNGHGMSQQDIETKWLRIGHSAKLLDPYSPKRRRKTGEKGVGRVSADRLGSDFVLCTKTADSEAIEVHLNWDEFDVVGREIGAVPITLLKGATLRTPSGTKKPWRHGTTLTITSLRQTWTEEDVRALHDELAMLMPPFQRVEDFAIVLRSDVGANYSGRIRSPFLEMAEIDLTASLRGGSVTYEIRDRIGSAKKPEVAAKKQISWSHLVQRAHGPRAPAQKELSVGPVDLRLLFYPRKGTLLQGTDFRVSDLREFLNLQSGIKVYRDFVRVRPYGDPGSPEGDWLGLAARRSRNPAGVGRPSYRIAANQIVGGVFIGRDSNPELVDSAGREGLIESEALAELRAFVTGCLSLLEGHRHEAYAEATAKTPERRDPSIEVDTTVEEITTLKKDLKAIRKVAPAALLRSVDRALDQADTVSERIAVVRQAVEEALADSGVLRGLATLGISATVFGHETQSAIASFLASSRLAKDLLGDMPPSVDIARKEIEKGIRSAGQVAAWGSFALARVRRDKRLRRRVDLTMTVGGIVDSLRPAFASSKIDIQLALKSVVARTFEMDVESVLVNLLTNAYVAAQQVETRKIRIELGPKSLPEGKGFELAVSDSGPGIPASLRPQVWQPLFTTKKDAKGRESGTGLGLTIVRSIVDDLRGKSEISTDAKLGGARVAVWFPLR